MIYSQQPPKLRQAVIAALFIATASKPADACRYTDPTVWETIERMSVGELAVTLVLLAFLALLVTISFSRGRAILRAVRQNRGYECRALTALYYERPEEAVSVCALFPSSPVATVVTASFVKSPLSSGSTSRPLGSSKPAVQRAVIAQTIGLKQRLWILAAIAWSSPVLGLATALANSGPYSVYLPFCFGLLIAAPALWLHMGLSGEVELLLFETDRMSLSIIDQIDNQMRTIDKPKGDGALFDS
jgi:biopolymer transport protein ExbB/TolQ